MLRGLGLSKRRDCVQPLKYVFYVKKIYSTLSKLDEQTDLVLVCKVAFYQYYVSFFFFFRTVGKYLHYFPRPRLDTYMGYLTP